MESRNSMDWTERFNQAIDFIEHHLTEKPDCEAIADIPDIEVYIQADPENAVYEYWLPVI